MQGHHYSFFVETNVQLSYKGIYMTSFYVFVPKQECSEEVKVTAMRCAIIITCTIIK